MVKIILPVVRLLTELWLISQKMVWPAARFGGWEPGHCGTHCFSCKDLPFYASDILFEPVLAAERLVEGKLASRRSACPLSLDQRHSGSVERSIIQEEKQPVGQERLQQPTTAVYLLGKLLVIVIAFTCSVLHFCCWGAGHAPTLTIRHRHSVYSTQKHNKSLSLTFPQFSYHITVTNQTNIIDNCHISQTLL